MTQSKIVLILNALYLVIYPFFPSSWKWGIPLHKQATFGAPVYSTDIDISPHITQLGCGISCQNLIKPLFSSIDGQKTIYDLPIDEFNFRLTQYLFSPSGSKYRLMFKYDSPISCGKPAPKILVCKIYLPRLKIREFQINLISQKRNLFIY